MAQNEKPLTKAEAAKLCSVDELVLKDGQPVLDKDGNPTTKARPLTVEEVFGFREYDDHVMVVTVAGRKIRGEKK